MATTTLSNSLQHKELFITLCKYPSSSSQNHITPTLNTAPFRHFSVIFSLKSRHRNVVAKLASTKHNSTTKTVEPNIQRRVGSGISTSTDERKAKKHKKTKVGSVDFQLRVGLDMCSKRGDVMGAISLYDLASRDGVELGQYHYTVLLYLCSSAAAGVVQPAKSGSSSRSFEKLVLNSRFGSGIKQDFGENGDVDSRDFGKMELNSWVLNGVSVDFGDNGGEGRLDFDGLESNSRSSSGFSEVLGKHSSMGGVDFHGQNYGINDSNFQVGLSVGIGKHESDVNKDYGGIRLSGDIRRYALSRGFEIYQRMLLEKIPPSEAALTSVARMAMSMGDGDLAFEMVKKMKAMGINPRLRSYGPALFTFCNNKEIEKAFEVEEHMLESGVYPEEPELAVLLKLSIEVGRGEKVYSILHKLRRSVRKVSPSTTDLIEQWFTSTAASKLGKRKWDQKMIHQAMEDGGGGWHGFGWLGQGKWTVLRTIVGENGVCKGCGEKLVTIDIDPIETKNFAKSVALIAGKREHNSNFQKFQKWLDYYGPFEAVVDAANVGLFSQKRFMLSRVNAVVNGIRQKLPSKRWPLIVVHNKRISGGKANEPANKKLIEKWKNADALYATPTGSNDDWYWLYAAIKCKGLIVTNDEMRDHVFQILGNDFFSKWKERHQVHFRFRDGGPEFHMPPPCSVVIQESENGHWHIPIASEHASESERSWLCVTRANLQIRTRELPAKPEEIDPQHARDDDCGSRLDLGNEEELNSSSNETFRRSRKRISTFRFLKSRTILSNIETAEKIAGCVIDFQI